MSDGSEVGEVKKLLPVFSAAQLKARVAELGEQLTADYTGRKLLCVGMLNGAVFFFADLVREIRMPLQVDFMRVSSYGSGTTGGELHILQDVHTRLTGFDVLMIEDIVDSGQTMSRIMPLLMGRGARSLKLCALIDKRERRDTEVTIDYTGFVLDKGFLVGYGLDLAERYRNLPEICEVVL